MSIAKEASMRNTLVNVSKSGNVFSIAVSVTKLATANNQLAGQHMRQAMNGSSIDADLFIDRDVFVRLTIT